MTSDPDASSRSTCSATTPNPEALAALDRQRLQEMIRQAQRVSVAAPAGAVIIGIMVWPAAPPWQIGLWFLVFLCVLAIRGFALRWLGADPTSGAVRRTVWLGVLSGLVHGAPAWLFMPALNVERKALLTMMLVSYATTAISTNAYYLPAYLVYSTLLLLPLIVVWLVHGFAPMAAGISGADFALQLALPALIVFFLFIQYGFARQAEATFERSFWIRHDNDQLLVDLRREREALAVARDRAESANRAKSRFLASASHDLRQPSHTLALFVEALRLRPLDDGAREIVRNMNEAMHELASQLDQLLDISKLDAGVVTISRMPLALCPFLKRLTREAEAEAGAKGVDVELHCEPTLTVETDASQLQRIVRNLLGNAVKFTDAGSVRVRAIREGASVRVTVADTGRGIPPAEHESVFEEFYQVDNPERDRKQGLGLGLAIVRRLAALLEIDLSMRSTLGVGTTFELLLAAVDVPVAEPAVLSPPELAPLHALVIDDEEKVRVGMRTLLEAVGCRVSLAADRAQALAAAARERPDIVLADFRLRGEENGIDVVRALRALDPDLPAVLISGDTDPQRLIQAREAQLPLLHKPLLPDELKRTIAAAMADRTKARA